MAQSEFLESSGPGHPLARKFLLGLLRLLMRLLLRFEITGVNRIPLTGPVVVVINHIAFLDPVLVLDCIPRRIVPMVKIEAAKSPVWRHFINLYGAIPVRRGQLDIQAFKDALRILKQGGLILLAPEGTRSRTHRLQPARDGAVMLALRSQATIVPIGVTGTHRIKEHWLKFKRPPVRMRVGAPFRLQPPDSGAGRRPSRQEISAMTREIMYRLAALLPPEYRGVYSNLDEATGTYLTPADD